MPWYELFPSLLVSILMFIQIATCLPIPQKVIDFWLQGTSELSKPVPGGLVFNLDRQLKRKGKGKSSYRYIPTNQ